jgi:adenylate cyclase
MGVNLGDVIVEPEDIFGGGVNVAARLEALAEPGGIASRGSCAIRSGTSTLIRSRTWESKASRTLEREYFVDGMVEEIITALSRIRWLFVIARNSSFTYKGQAINVKQVGRELGVRYVLEGSVRKAGGRVRITAQLINALSV